MRGKGSKSQVAFNAGEWSSKLDGRVDLEKYNAACLQLQNYLLYPYGGIYRRPGTQFIAETKIHSSASRLIDFKFSITTTFILELGASYIRFYSNGTQVMDGSVPYEISSPWSASEVFDIQYVQINDVMYLVHPSHPVQKLTRLSDTSWTLAEVEFDSPAFLDENLTDVEITPTFQSGGTGTVGETVTLTATGPSGSDPNIFTADNVGGYFQVRHLREGNSIEFDLNANGNSSSLTVFGTWNVRSYGNWGGDVLLQRSDDNGSTWTTIRKFLGDYDRNIDAEGEQDTESLFRIRFENRSAPPSGTDEDGRIVIEAVDSYITGICKITAVGSGATTNEATATITQQFESESSTSLWSEGAWSVRRGFPRAVGIFEQRIVYGGSTYQAQTVWGSVTGDFENLEAGVDDSDGFSYTLGSQERNQIQWLVGQTVLLIGTSGGEWSMSGGTQQESLTPSNVLVKRQSTYGSDHIQAQVVNEVCLFVQRGGKKLRELVYSFERDGWVAPDLTLLSEHVTGAGIVQSAYQQKNDSIYWAVTSGGNLIGMTYDRAQNVVGWHRHVTDGTFESVAVSYGTGSDEVWAIVNRTIGGSTKRYVERINPTEWTDKEDAFYVDSGLSYDGSPATVFSGLDHLEGETVQILADGAVEPSQAVSSGQITLTSAASVVHVGLGYDSIVQPMKLDVDGGLGNIQEQKKQVRQINVRFLNSLGLTYNVGGDDVEFPFRDTIDYMDASPPLFTGSKNINVNAPFNYDGTVILKQTQPLPSTILLLNIRFEATGN